MSETPRTDAHVRQLADFLRHPHWIEFARKLERELAELNAQFDEELEDSRWASSNLQFWELKAKMAESRLKELEAFNIELQRTHQGGQTGVECAELQAQNNALRHELGLAHQMRKAQP